VEQLALSANEEPGRKERPSILFPADLQVNQKETEGVGKKKKRRQTRRVI